MIAAAGNLGPGGPRAYPAGYGDVIAVTPVDSRRRVFRRANQGTYIDLAAPGVRIWTAAAGGAGDYVTGTSFAAPFVTAAAAALLAETPGASPAWVRRRLIEHAVDLGQPGLDIRFGWGLVQAPRGCAAR